MPLPRLCAKCKTRYHPTGRYSRQCSKCGQRDPKYRYRFLKVIDREDQMAVIRILNQNGYCASVHRAFDEHGNHTRTIKFKLS